MALISEAHSYTPPQQNGIAVAYNPFLYTAGVYLYRNFSDLDAVEKNPACVTSLVFLLFSGFANIFARLSCCFLVVPRPAYILPTYIPIFGAELRADVFLFQLEYSMRAICFLAYSI